MISRSSPLPSCFRRPSAATTAPTLTTSLYTTDVGLFALSWARSRILGRSLHLHLHHHLHDHHDSFHLHIKTYPFFHNKKGSKKLNLTTIHNKQATIFWDLSNAKYGPGPEPVSGFYIAIVIDRETILLVGDDSHKETYLKTGGAWPVTRQSPMILRRENVHGTKPYSTKAKIGGRERNVSIECRIADDPRLYISIDDKRILQIKHLKWKFRGSESVEVDGIYIQISWDVYNWLFNHHEDGHALFMFTIFNKREEREERCRNINVVQNHRDMYSCNGILSWPDHHELHHQQRNSLGLGFGERKMKREKRSLLRRAAGGRSSSFSSFSSSAHSSGSCSSSVMEWADNEDDEFMNYSYSGFSLLVYAWKT